MFTPRHWFNCKHNNLCKWEEEGGEGGEEGGGRRNLESDAEKRREYRWCNVYAHCQHLEDCPQFFAELHSFQHDLGVWHQSDHVTGWWVWPPDHERCPPHLQDNTGRKQHCQLVAWFHGESCQPPFPKEMIDNPPPPSHIHTHTPHTWGSSLLRGS